ncbi:phospholipase A-2-activating protein [Venturia canescens]|uniref:phospholipase A-2-activating protein n=1 Tax=Venturia canescens TaxID=32260 RepID=UPI001C9CE435|nr:phospholipase A-2-activating protein [Venturia canescens]XP_043269776.1 phospholipase A-2-activating protein [Venturia canescens]
MSEEPYKLNCVLLGHTLDVRALATFRDGTIVSASRDKTARVWTPGPNGMDYRETAILKGHKNFVSSVCAINPSEAYPKGLVVTGSNDNHICVYVLGEVEPVERFQAHENTVCNLHCGHVNGTFLSSSWDLSAKLWQLEDLGKPSKTFVGHTAAVWCVIDLPNGSVVTGSADKTVIVWNRNTCSVVHTLTGHTDCVRGAVPISDDEFLTCANDATVRHWNSKSGTCLGEFTGHENYIYSIAATVGGNLVVTSGEDRTLRVWKNGVIDDIVAVPAQSVWCCEFLSNGDIVAGSSDCAVRIFTANKERYAHPAAMQAFEEEVAKDQLQAKLSVGAVKIRELPGPTELQKPGREDGQTKMINENGKAKAYMWSMSERKWTLVGDVMGGIGGDVQSSGKQLYNGEEYDYVFSVDIQDGVPPLKLPYNVTEDPWHAAQKFIHRNGLSQMFLDQVANFIVKNSQSVPVLKSDSQFADPFTGASRYVPGAGTPNAPRSISEESTPSTSSSQMSTVPSYIPHVDYLKLEHANLPTILEKLKELNKKIEKSGMTDEQLESVVRLASSECDIETTNSAVEILKQLLQWPPQVAFPSLDVARLAVLRKTVNKILCTEEMWQLVEPHLKSDAVPANQMLTFRLLANMFVHEIGERLGLLYKDQVLNALVDLKSLGSKNNQVALSTYLLNLIIAVNKRNDSAARTRTLYVLIDVLPRLSEPEAVFRALVGLGTLLVTAQDTNDRKKLIRSVRESEEALALLRMSSESAPDINAQNKVANCSKQIIDLII